MKPRLLICCDYFLPGYKAGGPIRSLQNLIQACRDEFDIYVATRNHDFTDFTLYSEHSMQSTQRQEQIHCYYFSENELREKKQFPLFSDPQFDLIYLNSFFSVFFSRPVVWQAHRRPIHTPIIIAPRGELSEGALRIKAVRKHLYLTFAKGFRLYKKQNIYWHATSNEEAHNIKQLFGKTAKILHASNITKHQIVALHERTEKKPNACNIVFCSRISRKKNLNYALAILSQVQTPVIFDIYGLIEDPVYWRECQQLIEKCPRHIRVQYCGELKPTQVLDTLKQYDLFFLPTMNENFGHAILESLCAGTPVLLSDTTPWRQLAEQGMGWEFPLTNMADFKRTIEMIALMSPDAHRVQCARTLQRIQQILANDNAIQDTKRLFQTALGKPA